MKIFSTSDRIPFVIGEVRFLISPLTWRQRGELLALMQGGGKEAVDRYAFSANCLKFSIKGISGVTQSDGTPYVLEFDENGSLTDECVSDIMSLDSVAELLKVCTLNLSGLSPEAKVDGVEFKFDEVTSTKKKPGPAGDRQG